MASPRATERGESPPWTIRDVLLVLVIATITTSFLAVGFLELMDWSNSAPPDEVGEGLGFRFGHLVEGVENGSEVPTDWFPIWAVAILQVPLWCFFLGAPWLFSRRGKGLVEETKLRFKGDDLALGLVIGAFAQIVLGVLLSLMVEGLFPDADPSRSARELTARADSPGGVLIFLFIVTVGAPIVEEIFYRGFLFRAIDGRFGRGNAIFWTSAIFAAAHLNPIAFPALLGIGLVTALLVHRYDRLGPAIAAHIGFNAIAAINLLGDVI